MMAGVTLASVTSALLEIAQSRSLGLQGQG